MPTVIRFAAIIALLGLLPAIRAESPSHLIKEGNEAYSRKLYDKSIESYRKALEQTPSSPIVQYNLGTALAQKGDLDESMEVLGLAADTGEGETRAKSLYNLGVTMTEETDKTPQMDPSKQIAGLKQALGTFRQSILENPKDYEAKHNYEVLLKRIKQLEQQQKQQQQNGGDSDQKQDQQDPQNQDQQKNNQNKGQDGQQDQQQQNQDQDQQQQDKQNQNQQQKNQDDKKDQHQKDSQQQQQQDQDQQKDEQSKPQPQEPREGEGGQPLTPSQMDAQRLLNLLEQQDPDQFKKIFQARGEAGERPPKKAW